MNNIEKQESFTKWLVERKVTEKKANAFITVLDFGSQYCQKHSISQKSLWEIKSVREFNSVTSKLLGTKTFRSLFRNAAMQLDKVIPMYRRFLEETKGNRKMAETRRNPQSGMEKTSGGKTDGHAINILIDPNLYIDWLCKHESLSLASAKINLSTIKSAESYGKENCCPEFCIFQAKSAELTQNLKWLFYNLTFQEMNEKSNNRYFFSLRRYMYYILESTGFDVVADSTKIKMAHGKCLNLPVQETLQLHYPYGFNYHSIIEMMKFRANYLKDHEIELDLDDNTLINQLIRIGIECSGKVYYVSEGVQNHIENEIIKSIGNGHLIFYYDELYENWEAWNMENGIHSPEMLKVLFERLFPMFQHKQIFFLAHSRSYTELEALHEEIMKAWGGQIVCNVDDLGVSLPCVPMAKIKYALANFSDCVWNAQGEYIRLDRFSISEAQKEELLAYVEEKCDESGSLSFDDLPLEDLRAENYELSEAAFCDAVFSFLKNDFARNNKIITRIGKEIDVATAVQKYCRDKDFCTFSELEQVMRDTTGRVVYSKLVDAAHSAMIRVDYDAFVSFGKICFNVECTDQILDESIHGSSIGLKEITAFGMFPDCGFTWNLFVLESYCRHYSKKYKYMCVTPNSNNAGAIVRKDCDMNYHAIMANCIANSGVDIKEDLVFDYLVESGLIVRKNYTNIKALLEDAKMIRKGEN